jgi:hypothetical protein
MRTCHYRRNGSGLEAKERLASFDIVEIHGGVILSEEELDGLRNWKNVFKGRFHQGSICWGVS